MQDPLAQFDQSEKRFWETLRQTLVKAGFHVEVEPHRRLGAPNKVGAITKIEGFRLWISVRSEVQKGQLTGKIQVVIRRNDPTTPSKTFSPLASTGELNFKAISDHVATLIQLEKRDASLQREAYDTRLQAARVLTTTLRQLRTSSAVQGTLYGEDILTLPEGGRVEVEIEGGISLRIQAPMTESQLAAVLETCKKVGLL